MLTGRLSAILADDTTKSVLERLDPATRTKVFAALAGLLILGFLMLLLTWFGARVARRYMRRNLSLQPRHRRAVQDEDDWATKPLVPVDDESVDDVRSKN